MSFVSVAVLLVTFTVAFAQLPTCGRNEERVECYNECQDYRTCDDNGTPDDCLPTALGDCSPGCMCKFNFIRDRNGRCIDIRTCPPLSCSRNEVFTVCPPYQICTVIGEECGPPPGLCPQDFWDGRCVPMCLCREGYCRNPSGRCTREATYCFKSNEEYRSCRADQNCDGILAGEDVELPNPVPCVAGCRCVRGFVRNNTTDSDCVDPEQCFE